MGMEVWAKKTETTVTRMESKQRDWEKEGIKP